MLSNWRGASLAMGSCFFGSSEAFSWVSNRDVRKGLFQRNMPTLTKEKATKKKDRRNPQIFPKWGSWTKTKEKRWNFESEDKKKQGKIRIRRKEGKKRRFLKTGILGEQNSKNKRKV